MVRNEKEKVKLKPQLRKPDKIKQGYDIFIILGIILMTGLLYSNSINNSILNFDDNEYFANYPEVLNLSWQSIKTYFSSYYVIMYQPLPVLTFAINYHISGMDTAPMHIFNLTFHLLNILLVFYFIKKLSGKTVVATIAALFFAVHPMNVEAVSWISARSSGMYTFFYLAGIIFYQNYIKNKDTMQIVYCGIMFVFSLFSKAQAVTFPVVLVLLDYYYERKNIKAIIIEKIPFFLLSVVFGIVTIMNKGTMTNLTQGMLISYSYIDVFFMVCYSYMFYIYKLFAPFNLSAIYVYPIKTVGYLPSEYYLSPLIILLLVGLIYLAARKNKYILLGVALFIITITINIQLIPSRLFIVTERYAYFPYIGLFFIIGMFFSDISENKFAFSKQFKIPFFVVLVSLFLLFSVLTRERNEVWKNNLVFMSDVIIKNPPVPYLSRAYGTRGNYYLDNNDYKNAFYDFSKAIELKKDDELSYYNRGMLNIKMQKYSDAISDFDNAIKIKPDVGLMYCNRAVAKYFSKDYKSALTDCDKAISLNPSIIEAYNTRGTLRFLFNDFKGSEDDFNKAVSFNPNNIRSLKNRANLYLNIKSIDKACKDWSDAAELGDAEAITLKQQYCK